ncbi:MAG: restriction endonuclease [Desulfobaccales bacterium]
MKKATSTINPLHFEDLEPHRFEDLVRQLIYDFREWRSLEATGRSGSDEGFDIRGWEAIRPLEVDKEDEEGEDAVTEDRIWLIQCKREKSIPPAKIRKYLDDIFATNKENLYGLILVAPCDFSKKTRDTFIQGIREKSIQEFRLWGRAELEDMLFQPKNDHLLFAYFGISIVTRRRSLKTQIRSILSIKKKAIKYLGPLNYYDQKAVLLRDPEETRYPYQEQISDFNMFPRWEVNYFDGYEHNGLKFLRRNYYAYLADDKISFDFAQLINTAAVREDPWLEADQKLDQDDCSQNLLKFWNNEITEKNGGRLEIVGIIPFNKIIEIDGDGDNWFEGPHIYVQFDMQNGPFEGLYVTLKTLSGEIFYPELKNRIKFFPEEFRNRKK